jgi:hypothetical protein
MIDFKNWIIETIGMVFLNLLVVAMFILMIPVIIGAYIIDGYGIIKVRITNGN